MKCHLLSTFSRSPMNLHSSAEYLIMYGIFIVWNQVLDITRYLDISQRDENDFSPVENIVHHEKDFEIEEDCDDFDDHSLPNFNTVVGNILLELREHFNVTTKAACFIAEKMSQIIDSDQKLFSSVLTKSFQESSIKEVGYKVIIIC